MTEDSLENNMLEYLDTLDSETAESVEFPDLQLTSIDFLLEPLSLFTNLKSLNLSGNKLDRLPCLKEIGSLKEINLSGNPIAEKRPFDETFSTDILYPQTAVILNNEAMYMVKNLRVEDSLTKDDFEESIRLFDSVNELKQPAENTDEEDSASGDMFTENAQNITVQLDEFMANNKCTDIQKKILVLFTRSEFIDLSFIAFSQFLHNTFDESDNHHNLGSTFDVLVSSFTRTRDMAIQQLKLQIADAEDDKEVGIRQTVNVLAEEEERIQGEWTKLDQEIKRLQTERETLEAEKQLFETEKSHFLTDSSEIHQDLIEQSPEEQPQNEELPKPTEEQDSHLDDSLSLEQDPETKPEETRNLTTVTPIDNAEEEKIDNIQPQEEEEQIPPQTTTPSRDRPNVVQQTPKGISSSRSSVTSLTGKKNSAKKTEKGSEPKRKTLTTFQMEDIIAEAYANKKRYDQKCRQTNQPIEPLSKYLLIFLNQRYGLKTLISDYFYALTLNGYGRQQLRSYMRGLEESLEIGSGEGSKDDQDKGQYDSITSNNVAVFVSTVYGLVDDEFCEVEKQLKQTIYLLLRQIVFEQLQERRGEDSTKIDRGIVGGKEADGEMERIMRGKVGERLYDEVMLGLSETKNTKRQAKAREGSLYGVGEISGRKEMRKREDDGGRVSEREWRGVIEGLLENEFEQKNLMKIVEDAAVREEKREEAARQAKENKDSSRSTRQSIASATSLARRPNETRTPKRPSAQPVSEETGPAKRKSIPTGLFVKCVLDFQLFSHITFLQPFRAVFDVVKQSLAQTQSTAPADVGVPSNVMDEDQFFLLTSEILTLLEDKRKEAGKDQQWPNGLTDEDIITVAQQKIESIPEYSPAQITYTQIVNAFSDEIIELASYSDAS
ncbi:hypothetical protein BLNAU_23766 [Blattamonas nauphoetae]|uniref:Uncharacterized protein n=1 Tax=Blattamonas nauphoetae TaxID=2049346 RepID=A0ABQ9WS88_9EUKA|nr:hypothetical protein BLNAU_23766 [Blattamonas nauphoetae]